MNDLNHESENRRSFRLLIEGQLGGPRPETRILYELACACLDLQIDVCIKSFGGITGAVPEDPRPFLLEQCSGIMQELPADCRIVYGLNNPKSKDAKRLVWVPDPNTVIRNIPQHMEIWCTPSFASKQGLNNFSLLPAGINPIRFHPGITPFPLPIPRGSFIFLYHGPLSDGAYQNIIERCRASLERKLFYLVVTDYGFDSGESGPVPIYKGVLRIHGIRNERQLAGLYAAANCLIDPRPYDTIEQYQALGCGVPVLSSAPLSLGNGQWTPPCLFDASQLDETLHQIIAQYDLWQRTAADACRQVHKVMNWHNVATRLLMEAPIHE